MECPTSRAGGQENENPQDIVFMNTELIQRALEEVRKSKEDFAAMLEQAELGDSSVQYDLAVRYSEGDGVGKDPERAFYWFSEAALLGDVRAIARAGPLLSVWLGGRAGSGKGAGAVRACGRPGLCPRAL